MWSSDLRRFVALLVLPAVKAIEAVARERQLVWEHHSELIRHDHIRGHVETEVRKHFHGLASYETPKKIALIEGEFTVDNGLLTPSLKVKRKVVQERYKDLIEEIYAGGGGERD